MGIDDFRAVKTLILGAVVCLGTFAQQPAVVQSSRADRDVAPDTSPDSEFWRAAPAIFAVNDNYGKPVPGHRTEIRSRWTKDNLYFLYICPYEQLWLKPDPTTTAETNKLWDWDVAEVFIGSDFENIRHYKEFELSPQGEWVDLDIEFSSPSSPGVAWNSGFATAARIDRSSKIWYGVMRIPWSAIDTRHAAAGNKLRINFYRQQGPPPDRKEICWQPTQKVTFHVPESFGTLVLVDAAMPNAVDAGRERFNVRCAGCHGADGLGGERAPALASGRRERLATDAMVRDIIRQGIPDRGMPGFNIGDDELAHLTAFVRSRVAPLSQTTVAGDANAGEAHFFGEAGCSRCHMIKGRGGWNAPDLTSAGERLTLVEIEQSLRNPDAHLTSGYEVATVRLRAGSSIRGFIRNESGFDMQVQSLDGTLHMLRRDAIASVERERKSLMPALAASKTDTADLIAFLARSAEWTPSVDRQLAPIAPGSIAWNDVAQPTAGDWPGYNGVPGGNRYSELAHITTTNVRNLAPRWSFPVSGGRSLETTPVVVDGVMYVTAVNTVYALDAAAGRQIWTWSRPRSKGLVGDASGGINRGVAVLGDRVFLVTDNAHLVALHRLTGGLLWDIEMADSEQHYGATSAPLVVKDLVISGVSGGDEGVRGFLAAYRVSTGERVWRFWSIPARGDPEAATWVGKALEHGCGATWFTGTFDPATDTLFWPIGNPCPDFNGDERKGDNLYTDSVVALDPASGKLKWYYQFTPHDLHDWDATETPVLVDTMYRGQQRKLLLHGNRNGFFYVLDRTNGKFLAATPFVKKLTWAKGIGAGGRPILAEGWQPVAEGTETCPSMDGASNWMSPAFHPETGLFYLAVLEKCNVFTKNAEWWKKGQSFYGGAAHPVEGETPRKYIRAIDIQTGKIAWEYEQTGPGSAWAGVLATAGGLLFFGDDSGAFAALDARSGKPLWHFGANVHWHASPMTYSVGDRQFVAIAAGSSIIAFGLPD